MIEVGPWDIIKIDTERIPAVIESLHGEALEDFVRELRDAITILGSLLREVARPPHWEEYWMEVGRR